MARVRSSTPAVRVRRVVKRFGGTTALAGVDLEVAEGTVFGLLGPNGAGKTTLVRILATLLEPDSGRAEVFGRDVVQQAVAVRELLGLTGQFAAVDEILTGRENLEMFGRLFDLSPAEARQRSAELLRRFDLADAADRPARTYSGGMRRRLDLASSLLTRPRILFLDEPTTGLDPRSRNEIWGIVRDLALRGPTLDDVFLKLTGAPPSDNGAAAAQPADADRAARVPQNKHGGRSAALPRLHAASPTELRSGVTDAWVVTARNLRHFIRQPQLLIFSTIQPIMFVL